MPHQPIDVRWNSLILCALITLSAAPCFASPWTLPKDALGLDLSYDFLQANTEFLPDGKFQKFPLEGEFLAHNFRIKSRYGFTDRLEGSAEVTLKSVTYESDPVLPMLPETDGDPIDIRDVRRGILDFSQTRFGAGDIWLRLRYGLIKTATGLSLEAGLKVPTGYEAPRETLVNNDDGSSSVADDVALGDGQADVEMKVNFGQFISPSRSFITTGIAGRYRFGSPGPSASAELKFGQLLGPHFLFFFGGELLYTLIDGEVIGQTLTSTDPGQSAINFSGTVERVDLRLDKDSVTVRGGFIVTFASVEVQSSYSRVVWGRNIPAINTLSIGTVIKFPAALGEQGSSQ